MTEPADDAPVVVRLGTAADAGAAARLHAGLITEGFLARLGPRFLRHLYRRVAAAPTPSSSSPRPRARRTGRATVPSPASWPAPSISAPSTVASPCATAWRRRCLLFAPPRSGPAPGVGDAAPRRRSWCRRRRRQAGPSCCPSPSIPPGGAATWARSSSTASWPSSTAGGRADAQVVVGADNAPAVALYDRARLPARAAPSSCTGARPPCSCGGPGDHPGRRRGCGGRRRGPGGHPGGHGGGPRAPGWWTAPAALKPQTGARALSGRAPPSSWPSWSAGPSAVPCSCSPLGLGLALGRGRRRRPPAAVDPAGRPGGHRGRRGRRRAHPPARGRSAPSLVAGVTVLLINGVNMIDGLDALAGGVVAVAARGLRLDAAGRRPGPGRGPRRCALAGFLVYNRPPARIYLGDGGSYLLGTALAVLLASAWAPGTAHGHRGGGPRRGGRARRRGPLRRGAPAAQPAARSSSVTAATPTIAWWRGDGRWLGASAAYVGAELVLAARPWPWPCPAARSPPCVAAGVVAVVLVAAAASTGALVPDAGCPTGWKPVSRIYLSPPDVGDEERRLLLDAFDSNWIAPLGPHVDAFEPSWRSAPACRPRWPSRAGPPRCTWRCSCSAWDRATTSSCPVADLRGHRQRGDLRGGASGARRLPPRHLDDRSRPGGGRAGRAGPARAAAGGGGHGGPLRAVRRLRPAPRPPAPSTGSPLSRTRPRRWGPPTGGEAAGSFGSAGVFSFNGNKIITTSGGGMLVSHDSALDRPGPLPLDPGPPTGRPLRAHRHRLQLPPEQPPRRRGPGPAPRSRRAHGPAPAPSTRPTAPPWATCPGSTSCPEAPYGEPNYWLTCILVDPDAFGATHDGHPRRPRGAGHRGAAHLEAAAPPARLRRSPRARGCGGGVHLRPGPVPAQRIAPRPGRSGPDHRRHRWPGALSCPRPRRYAGPDMATRTPAQGHVLQPKWDGTDSIRERYEAVRRPAAARIGARHRLRLALRP